LPVSPVGKQSGCGSGGATTGFRRKLSAWRCGSLRKLRDLSLPPGNRLEALKGGRAGQHSIRVNDQWRICFRWLGEDAHDVEFVDYH
jgi:proteic killer suppression protein